MLLVVGLSKKGLPTFPMLIKLFSSVDLLLVNKCMVMAEGFPTLSALVSTLPILKVLSICNVPMWLSHTMKRLVLERACAGWEVLPTFPACEGPLCHVDSTVFHK